MFGPERILLGTDSNVFPAGWRKERLDEQRAIAESIGMSDHDQALLFSGNAARLLGL